MRPRLLRLAIVLAAALCILAPAALANRWTTDRSLQLRLTGVHIPVPKAFFGLSTEANQLPTYENAGTLFARFLSMVRPRDGSSMLLRIGGMSTDAALWKVSPPPGSRGWAFELGDAWLGRLASLVKHQNLRVMLGLNLAVHSPSMAAAFAQAAADAIPGGHLVALGIGNEPDLYREEPRLQHERVSSTLASVPLTWTAGYSPSTYQDDYRLYANALAAVTPRIPLFGPDTTSSSPSWVAALSTLAKLGPSLITMHRYGYSACFDPSNPFYPTVPRLMKQSATGGIAARLHHALTVARTAGLPLRVTELNAISCGGKDGVANTFATALWTPDALFELMRAGVVGVNWHIRPTLNNAPFHLTSSGFQAMPELYGLALFNGMIGHGSQLEGMRRINPMGLNVKAWAVRTGRMLKLLLINKSGQGATVGLDGEPLTPRPARISFLTGPALGATTGVTLAGRSIGPDARWHGRYVTDIVRRAGGLYTFKVMPYSAEVIRLSYAP